MLADPDDPRDLFGMFGRPGINSMELSPRDLLDRLVAFPMVSDQSNLELVNFVDAYLSSHGITSIRVPSQDGSKAALYASVGPDCAGGVVLTGHTDVVPVAGQDWDSSPFVVREANGRLYGCGTCDMKGFDALSFTALVQANKRDLKRPLQIALSYDEETGMTGAPPMIDHMCTHGTTRAATVIVGEPSMMKVVTGHKGGFGYQVHVRGHQVHSSLMHEGVSAVMIAAELVHWTNAMNAQSAAAIPSHAASGFVPPYTTSHVGTITGGTAHNITADDCRFEIDFRALPEEDHEVWKPLFQVEVARLQDQMRTVHPETFIDAFQDFGLVGLAPETDGAAEALVRQLTGNNASGVVSYLTEGGLFQEVGYSTVVCGPGDIAQAHQPNEYIPLEQFRQGEAFMGRLVDALSA